MNYKSVNKMTWAELLKDHEFRAMYVTLYNTAHNNSLDLDGEAHFARETGYLKILLMDSTYFQGATTLSIMTMLLDLAYHGLSLAPGSKPLAYALPRSHKIKGADGVERKELRLLLGISPYGEIALRIRSGIIAHVDNPTMVYEGDYFKKTTRPDGGIRIDYEAKFTSEKIVRAFVKITRFDGTYEYKDFSLEDMERFRSKSDSQKSAAWTGGYNGGISRGMWEAKVLKHAFNSYPRLKLGQNTESADDYAGDATYASIMGKFGNQEDDDEPTNPAGQTHDEEDDVLGERSDSIPVPTPEEQPAPKEKPKAKAAADPPPPPPPVEISKPDSDNQNVPVYDFT